MQCLFCFIISLFLITTICTQDVQIEGDILLNQGANRIISLEDGATSFGSADDLTIRAGHGIGFGTYGGNLVLKAGDGSELGAPGATFQTGGDVIIQPGDGGEGLGNIVMRNGNGNDEVRFEQFITRFYNSTVTEGNQFVEGNVGIGTESPDEPLSFQGTLGPKINLFDGSGIYGFGMAPAELQIGTFDDTKHISLGHYSGSSKTFVEWMEVNTNSLKMTKSGAYVTSGGVWTDASSRSFKENISKLTLEEATLTLAELTPVKFNYKLQKDEEYIGFIAEDVPQLVATKDRKGLSPMDIVAVLTRVVQKQQSEIADLKVQTSEMNNLKREMAELKALFNAQINNLSEE